MHDVDYEAVVRAMVREELTARLAAFRPLLARLDRALREVPRRHGPGRPPRADLERTAQIVLGRGQRGPATADRPPAVEAPKPGETVRYRQGRGTFEARLVRVDAGRAVLERSSDGKRLTRPLAKLC